MNGWYIWLFVCLSFAYTILYHSYENTDLRMRIKLSLVCLVEFRFKEGVISKHSKQVVTLSYV